MNWWEELLKWINDVGIATLNGMMAFYGVAWIFVFVFFGFSCYFCYKYIKTLGKLEDIELFLDWLKEDLGEQIQKLIELLRKH